MTKNCVEAKVAHKETKPERSAHLLESIRVSANALIEKILDIDYMLLTYRRISGRAQPRVQNSLVLEFIAIRRIRAGLDTDPVMLQFFKTSESGWDVRKLNFEPGKLHLSRAFGKCGIPFEQDSVVVALLKEIDNLLQLRSKLIELTRPLRQNTNGLITHAKKKLQLAANKVDRLSPRILIDFSNPSAAREAILKKQAAREALAAHKLARAKSAQK